MDHRHDIKSVRIGDAWLSYEKKGTKIVSILRGSDGKTISKQIRSPKGLEQSVNMLGVALWVAKNITKPKPIVGVTRSALTAAVRRELLIARAIT